jgi:hypothetical protein
VAQVADGRISWRIEAVRAARRLAAVTALGALLGLLVGGVGGRLAMMLLARLNTEVSGITSDDGFTIGQFTLSDTAGLLVLTTFIGVFGAGVYVVVRPLMIGPRWFQVLSVAGGAGVVAGAVIVHTDGVDFRLLDPAWLAIALFVAIPGAYAALLTLVAEPLLEANSRLWRTALLPTLAPLVLWVPLAPMLVALALAWVARQWMGGTPLGAAVLRHPAVPWVARLGLAVLFVLGAVDLTRDAAELV